MKSFNLPTLIGNPADTTLTFAKLIFGGVLEWFPKLKFLLAHAGGFLLTPVQTLQETNISTKEKKSISSETARRLLGTRC